MPALGANQEPRIFRGVRDIALARRRTLWHDGEGFSERGRGETVDAADFTGVLWSAREETRGVEPPKFGES